MPFGVTDRDELSGRRDRKRPGHLDADQLAAVGQHQDELAPSIALEREVGGCLRVGVHGDQCETASGFQSLIPNP